MASEKINEQLTDLALQIASLSQLQAKGGQILATTLHDVQANFNQLAGDVRRDLLNLNQRLIRLEQMFSSNGDGASSVVPHQSEST